MRTNVIKGSVFKDFSTLYLQCCQHCDLLLLTTVSHKPVIQTWLSHMPSCPNAGGPRCHRHYVQDSKKESEGRTTIVPLMHCFDKKKKKEKCTSPLAPREILKASEVKKKKNLKSENAKPRVRDEWDRFVISVINGLCWWLRPSNI